MKKTKNFLYKSLAVVALAGTMVSCEDINLCGITEDDLDMGDAFIETTSYFMNVVSRVDEAMRNEDLQNNGSTTIDGATVTLANDSITVDFGTSNVICQDGKSRRGKISGSITGDYFTQAGSINLNLTGYHVDDVPVVGNIAVTNTGQTANNWVISLVSSNFTIGTEYNYNANLSMEWESGFTTTDSIEDDVFELYGMAHGNDLADTISFSTSFTENMRFERTCQYVVTEGIVDVSLTSGTSEVANVTVDFKDEDGCNNVVFLNANCDGTEVSFPHTFDGF
ncbi:hypothetical protein [Phaeocystidibacter marisrubri]|uniref:Uncharacterized protein n=1 Tax=Phaeocystidibacter marisrubri TaxID=1577780 RepID=A0A6L3ZJF6_9FLAO|nr:hypothetical protein [Phaeocystidibacter marisrubri]KAB2817698.1 hypothetical protein F8C82_04650 [Phaeocystidibacter marisrubri]GGH74038.1 hypothetical protein GCM10011318_19610 [Phaeocystidibacter marisrubri]